MPSRREAPVAGPADWGTEWAEAVALAAATLHRSAARSEEIDVVLPSVFTLARTATCPRAAARRGAAVAAFAATTDLPLSSAETVAMHAVTGGEAGRLDLTVLVARTVVVERLLGALERAGWCARAVLPHPLAVLAGLPPELAAAPDPQLVLEGDATSAVIWRLQRGRTLVRAFRLPSDFPADGAAGQAAVLAGEVRRTLVHCARQGAEARPQRLWIAGDWSAPSALGDALGAQLALSVPACPVPTLGSSLAEHGALALARSWRPGPGLDLTPPTRRAAARWQVLRRMAAVAAAGLALALLGSGGIEVARARGLERDARAIQQRIAPARAASVRRDALRARVAFLEAEVATLARLHAARAAWPARLADLEARFHRAGDARLEGLELLSPDTATAPGRIRLIGRIRGESGDLRFRGRALAASLAAAPWIESLEPPSLHQEGQSLRFDFKLTLRDASAILASAGSQAVRVSSGQMPTTKDVLR